MDNRQPMKIINLLPMTDAKVKEFNLIAKAFNERFLEAKDRINKGLPLDDDWIIFKRITGKKNKNCS